MVDYDILTLPKYAYTNEIGKPQLPVIRELLTIPEGSSVNVTILECDNSTYKNFNIYPVQPQKTDEANESSLKESTSFVIDREFYNQDRFYPGYTIKVGTQGIWRDLAVVNLEFNPILFNPATGELNVISHIKVALRYSQSINTQMKLNESKNAIDPEFDKMYKQLVLNYNSIKSEELNSYLSSETKYKAKDDSILNEVGVDNEIDADPVILSIRHEGHSTFSATKPLLDWHASNGQPYVSWYFYSNVEVNDTMIKDLIAARYADYPSLKYVIIWGDIDFMPWHLANSAVTSGDKIPGDYWYGLLAGDDLYPELAIGRMSVDGDAEVQNVVTKTLSYLNAPEGWWSDNVLLVAHKEGAPSQFQGNKETIRSATYSYPLIYSHLYGASAGSGGDSATNEMVNRAINNRVGIVNYRGHGGATCWCSAWNAANEDYTTANAASLSNVITPVLFAICCQTAELDSSSQTLSEAFTKPSSIGAVCYFGASRPSWRGTNDLMDRYIFDAIGNLNIRDTGLITDSAKSRVLTIDNSAETKDNINMYLWLGDPALPIRHYPGTKIAIQASNGQYVCAEGSGGGAVVANRNSIGSWETFTLINRGNDNIALQAANGQYVCAEGSGGGAVVANRNAIGSWETFKLVDKGNGYYALNAANGQYVCAEGSGGGSVVANRNAIGSWEKFRFLDLSRPAKVALQAANGQYVCAEGSGGGSVVANRNAIGAWETLNLVNKGNGNVALQAANGQYVCAEGSGGGSVVANRNAIGAWETFRLIFRGNGNVALQAANGQYVCAEGSGGGSVVANRNAIGAWETFKLIPI
ncbi:MAG: C25 family cysteine peptidase [Methanothrix sp.]|nr:C25 family cysteine peptidase [Methanothrix sp.]